MTVRWFDLMLRCVGCDKRPVRPPRAPREGVSKKTLHGGCKWCGMALREES